MRPKYKEVSLPITVPKSKYCWEGTPPFSICEHYSNEGGHSKCDMNFHPLKTIEKRGVPKPKECRRLK